ncbi:hypothetical protein WUBG_03981 [Wuchereria bancrofti]|uniref:Uncharacterized protein n=1 Tax=Wuchereria bancrofti TaxID=6293 RepID=J9BD72_WUCBA|nr:hypothetical protein WUBG_03981 [Wuchereria bancrofti]
MRTGVSRVGIEVRNVIVRRGAPENALQAGRVRTKNDWFSLGGLAGQNLQALIVLQIYLDFGHSDSAMGSNSIPRN